MSKQKSFTIDEGFEFMHDIAHSQADTIHFIDPALMCIEYSTVSRSFQCRPLRNALRESMDAALIHQPFLLRIVFIGTADMCQTMLEVVK